MNRQGAYLEETNVLIVDDVIAYLAVLVEMITKAGYVARPVTNVKQAMEAIEIYKPHLILLDISMPDMDGFEFCEILKSTIKTKDIPIIFISAMDSREDKIRGFQLGAVDFIVKPFDLEEVILRVESHINTYQKLQEMETYNRKLQRMLSVQNNNTFLEFRNMLLTMAKLAEVREETVETHFNNVGRNCRLLAISLQMSPQFENEVSNELVSMIELAAPLHDIGKAGIPDSILCKPGKLTLEEMEEVKKHSELGARVLMDVNVYNEQSKLLDLAIDIAYYHHEKWDGTGYPKGLKGSEIPIGARIMAVIDVYDTLVSKRCYREPFTHEESLRIINEEAGKSFDPEIVKIFNKIHKQLIYNNGNS